MEVSHLALYKFDSCPFCQRVQDALRRLGATVEQRDIRSHEAHREELVAATGRTTVPVLRIEQTDGKVQWLPESLDIVRFLEQHFDR